MGRGGLSPYLATMALSSAAVLHEKADSRTSKEDTPDDDKSEAEV